MYLLWFKCHVNNNFFITVCAISGSGKMKSLIFYVCSYFGISSAVSQIFWVYVISGYTRESGSLTGTSLEPGMGSCEKTWKFPVFNMGLRIRVRVHRTLYFHWGYYAFIVANEAQTCQNFKLSAVCFLLPDLASVFKLWPFLPYHSVVSFFLHV